MIFHCFYGFCSNSTDFVMDITILSVLWNLRCSLVSVAVCLDCVIRTMGFCGPFHGRIVVAFQGFSVVLPLPETNIAPEK